MLVTSSKSVPMVSDSRNGRGLPSDESVRRLSQLPPTRIGRPWLTTPERGSFHRGSVSRRKSRKLTVHPGNAIGLMLGGSGKEEERLVSFLREGILRLYEEISEEGRQSDNHEVINFDFLGDQAELEEYDGRLFAAVRSAFGIVEKEYQAVLSEGGGNTRTGFRHMPVGGNNSKSSSWFLLVSDSRYMLKTCTEEEADLMLELLSSYLLHIRKQEFTLLPRFYGLYRLTCAGRSTCFFVMNNVFAARHEVVAKYDVKGSTRGRYASEREKEKGSKATLKDIDLLQRGHPLVLADGEEAHARILTTVDADSRWLSTQGLLDYSMMIGLANRPEGESKSESRHVVHSETLVASNEGDPNAMYLGIIDILTRFTRRKKVEACLSQCFCMGDVSCRPPSEYAARFRRFMRHVTCSPSDAQCRPHGPELAATWLQRGRDLANVPPANKGMRLEDPVEGSVSPGVFRQKPDEDGMRSAADCAPSSPAAEDTRKHTLSPPVTECMSFYAPGRSFERWRTSSEQDTSLELSVLPSSFDDDCDD